jgi:hypothetical protein
MTTRLWTTILQLTNACTDLPWSGPVSGWWEPFGLCRRPGKNVTPLGPETFLRAIFLCASDHSFDVLRDELGGPRSCFPHTMYLVAGSQAPKASSNQITLLKLDKLGQGRHGNKRAEEVDDEDSGSDADDEEPVLFSCQVAHPGGVNRIRSMPQNPGIVAAWSDLGQVQVINGSLFC